MPDAPPHEDHPNRRDYIIKKISITKQIPPFEMIEHNYDRNINYYDYSDFEYKKNYYPDTDNSLAWHWR